MRQVCRRLCSMRPGHARDNCRHIEIRLPAARVVSGHWWAVPKGINALITADHRNDSEGADESSSKDPPAR